MQLKDSPVSSSYARHIDALGASHATPFAEVVHRRRPWFLGAFAPREFPAHGLDGLLPLLKSAPDPTRDGSREAALRRPR